MATWLKFKLIDRPYYDKHGNTLKRALSTTGYGLAEIYGGGKLYPDMSKITVLEWHEKGYDLAVLVEGDQAEVDKLLQTKDVFLQASPKEVKIVPDGFKVKTFIAADKVSELSNIGIDISGVTK